MTDEQIVEAAVRDHAGKNGIGFDLEPVIVRTDDGAWVTAYIFVRKEELND